MPTCRTWDIFCTVVDNFGDAAVCWRLARQLAAEHGHGVRLWIDRPEVLQRLVPELDPAADGQRLKGVEIRLWREPFPAVMPHDGVIEAFACQLPDAFVQAMARRAPPPVWINLEYLSAEDWVPRHHGLASPHPRLPLVKHFFFPGFAPDTGGLLREGDLIARRTAFKASPAQQAAFWASLGIEPSLPQERRVSLFAYENVAVGELLEAWAAGAAPVTCLLPEGHLLPQVARALGERLAPGAMIRKGRLTLRVLPFLPQDAYDRLLWACDVNFVRGEDSFVRAQWAARPFVWHIYPQHDQAHWVKLEAFLGVYVAELAPQPAAALTALWQAWNRQSGVAAAWRTCEAHWTALTAHAEAWARHLGSQPDLASRLVQFCENML